MKKGCLGALAVVLILVAAAVLMVNAWLGAFPAARRLPVADFQTGYTVAAVSVDTRNPAWLRIVDEQLSQAGALGWLMGVAMPYECGVIVDVDPDKGTAQTTLAVSPYRFGPLLNRMLADEATAGTETSETASGAILLKTTETVSPETLALASERWTLEADEQLTLDRDHFLAAVVSNTNGKAFVALEGVLRALSAEKDPGEFEKQQVFDADQLSGLLYRIRNARVTGDLNEAGDLVLSLTAQCPDAVSAETIHFALLTVRDAMFRQAIEKGIVIEGEPYVDGDTIRGEFTIGGIKDAVAMALAAEGMGGAS